MSEQRSDELFGRIIYKQKHKKHRKNAFAITMKAFGKYTGNALVVMIIKNVYIDHNSRNVFKMCILSHFKNK